MEVRGSRKYMLMIIAIVMAIAVAFAFTQVRAEAATKTLKLVKDKNITYYKSGLIKTYHYADIYTGIYKYDEKGRVTEFRKYDGKKVKTSKLICVLNFEYDDQGKLANIYKYDYEDGEKGKQEKCIVKLDKKGRILKLKCKLCLADDYQVFAWSYDSKGRVKKNIFKAYYYEKVDTYAKRVIKRSSKGYLKKVTGNEVWGKDKMKYTNKYITKIKKGKVTNITMKGKKNYAEFYKYKYKKMKVDKKLVKAVKAQQLDALYLQAATVTTSPQFALIEIF